MAKPASYILIKDATVIAEAGTSPLAHHDILVRDDLIVAIGRNLAAPADGPVTTVRVPGCIAVPGFVDGHHHMWQQLLRGAATDWTLLDYTVHMRSLFGSLFTPDDVYLATHAAALSLLSNGVTSVLEHCHIINSPAHADAAVRALKDAGIRATFAYGFYQNPPVTAGLPADGSGSVAAGAPSSYDPAFTHEARLADAARVRAAYFGSNDPARELVTFGVSPDEPESQPTEKTVREIAEARELGARLITMHVAMGPCDGARRHIVQQLADAGVLGPDLVFSHGASFTDGELAAIRASGAGIVGTPDTELQMGMGFPVVFRARDAGCNACLGIDITSNQGNDFVAQMRLAIQVQRALQNEQGGGLPTVVARKTAEVLHMGTLGGARVLQLDHLVGTLEVGKKADIALVACDDLETLPVTDPVGAVVFHTSPAHIDTVIVDGVVRKSGGKLVADTSKLRDDIRSRGAELNALAATCDLTEARARWLKLLGGEPL
ncbi:hypothetical protein Micbo1qcDRAFT_154222 [Microdochium bolleyi]|uniref:Amidohydrolase-related domain-containing protein n=1 Tax=Microdochium bolleyi TaxID=196109 RepID=A0A136IKK1_9PEZI|nr:hypothetical protein Micbo1qcDRAFT_154222 [Microdochium bolleyi]